MVDLLEIVYYSTALELPMRFKISLSIVRTTSGFVNKLVMIYTTLPSGLEWI